MFQLTLVLASLVFGVMEIEKRAYLFDAFPIKAIALSKHAVANISSEGEKIELEDESIWEISPYDQGKAAAFDPKDSLILTQNHRWFSLFAYRLVHQNTGVCVEANLSKAPSLENSKTFILLSCDPILGTLSLINQKEEAVHWEIAPSDIAFLQNWSSDDPILIGQNSGSDLPYAAILINTVTSQTVQAREVAQ